MHESEELIHQLTTKVYPPPKIISCKPLNLNFVVTMLEKSEKKKEFYSKLFQWFLSSTSIPVAKSILNVSDSEDLRLASFGEIKNENVVQNLLKYLIKYAPGILISFAKETLPETESRYVEALVTKKKPPEFAICDKLRKYGIRSLSLLEDTPEYGVIARLIIYLTEFTKFLLKNPSSLSELFTSSKQVEWLVSKKMENMCFHYFDMHNRKFLLILEVPSVYEKEVLKKFEEIIKRWGINKQLAIDFLIDTINALL
mgnify:CR=1 FL=1